MTDHWIKAPLEASYSGSIDFVKTFETVGEISSATAEVTAVGIYSLALNGKRVTDRVLTPGFTSYDKRGIQLQEYDIKDSLQKENKITVCVAPGWAVGHIGFAQKEHLYADHVSVTAKITVVYKNGVKDTYFTDNSWDTFKGQVTFADIYDGETVDKSYTPEFLGKAVTDYVMFNIVPDSGEKICEHETFNPTLIITPKGEKVLDFGQNMTGYVSLKIKGKKGDKVILNFGEVLDKNGNFYNANYRTARNEITYILSGNEDSFKPQFSFQGFRYVLVKEYPLGNIDINGFTAITVHSNMKRTGHFNCGNAKINQLYHNIIWGQKSNYLDIPTDCPQRNERLGWTGDAQVFCKTAALNYDVRKFFEKWLSDLRAEQGEQGEIYGTCPEIEGIAPRGHSRISAAWGDAATIIPWTLYEIYGDKKILSDNFDMMCRWVDYIRNTTEKENLWFGGWHYGDWLALDAGADSYKGITTRSFISSAFFAYSTKLVICAGEVLGKDVSDYRDLYENILKAFRKEFLDKILSYKDDINSGLENSKLIFTQTAMTLILKFCLCEKSERAQITDNLVKLIAHFGGKMSTGFVGTPYIMHALSENGRTDVAYKLLFNEESPSWLYSVNKGATTMWEHWNGIKEDGSFWSEDMNSFNHYAYGAVGDWLYGVVAGIKVKEVGFKSVILAPSPDERLKFVDCSVETKYGKISSSWKYNGGKIKYNFVIPAGVTAQIILPDGRTETVGAGEFSF